MKFRPPDAEHSKSWNDCSVYPEDIVAGSDEHDTAHVHLFELARELPSDFEPYGQRVHGGWNSEDCSCGCRHYAELAGPLGHDWGVCMNKRSPRAGLLTFEHQGCPEFERGPERELRGKEVETGENNKIEMTMNRNQESSNQEATVADLVELCKQSAYFTIVLDEDLRRLETGLEDEGFKVILAQVLRNDDLKHEARGWAILTKNSQHLVDDAVRYDYDVIGVEGIKLADGKQDLTHVAVQKLAGAIRRSQLAFRKGNFLLRIRADGSFHLQQLI